MHPTTDLKSMKFSRMKKGEKYLVIDCLFVTLCNIKPSLGTAIGCIQDWSWTEKATA